MKQTKLQFLGDVRWQGAGVIVAIVTLVLTTIYWAVPSPQIFHSSQNTLTPTPVSTTTPISTPSSTVVQSKPATPTATNDGKSKSGVCININFSKKPVVDKYACTADEENTQFRGVFLYSVFVGLALFLLFLLLLLLKLIIDFVFD
ncbi:hypothetical protein [Dictyobacter aurantiacus]|uniref:Uncharacterized protein n=1 Tax=Dictyobacter aurantiacus TaxID=1936993 RepID=A0A401ZCU9_9CHLR|nr:hypothetical protein [Dictyobacter aurantiacus]GCE04707.1 hypothetical protein KDAU_20360 [Dictyobacter aurantiacus]